MAKIKRSTFYFWLEKLKNKIDKDNELKEEIKDIYDENKGRYGYRRITLELRNRGKIVNHKKVLRIMKDMNIEGIRKKRRRKYNSYRGMKGEILENKLKRNFKAIRPNQKWVTDVTEFKYNEQKTYLSPIIDLYGGEVIAYEISRRASFKQVENMLEKAFKKIPDNTNLILHSDQGWQYQMKQYQDMLKEKGIQQSMSRKGNCLDNACAENFFGILKSELYYIEKEKYTSIDELEQSIIEYIDYYNNRRIKSKLHGMSPVKYREKFQNVI